MTDSSTTVALRYPDSQVGKSYPRSELDVPDPNRRKFSHDPLNQLDEDMYDSSSEDQQIVPFDSDPVVQIEHAIITCITAVDTYNHFLNDFHLENVFLSYDHLLSLYEAYSVPDDCRIPPPSLPLIEQDQQNVPFINPHNAALPLGDDDLVVPPDDVVIPFVAAPAQPVRKKQKRVRLAGKFII